MIPASNMYMYNVILVTWQHGNAIIQLILMQATFKASHQWVDIVLAMRMAYGACSLSLS